MISGKLQEGQGEISGIWINWSIEFIYRISSSDIRQDDFYIDDDIPKSDDGNRDFCSSSIAELLENLSSDDELEL